jgi:hypothetical protein
MITGFLFVACDSDKDLMEYYKSQPKDANLMGWWDISTAINSGCCLYCKFDSYSKPEYYLADNGELKSRDGNHYWYTAGNLLYVLEYNESWMYGSIETSYKYEIRNDTLFLNNNVHSIQTNSPL